MLRLKQTTFFLIASLLLVNIDILGEGVSDPQNPQGTDLLQRSVCCMLYTVYGYS